MSEAASWGGCQFKKTKSLQKPKTRVFQWESPRAFSWEQLPQSLEIHTPWVSLPVSRSRVWKKGSSLQCRRGHGPLRSHHKRAEAFTSVKTCVCMSKWGRKQRRPLQVEAGKEREQTARNFPSGPHSCQENGTVFSTHRKRQKGRASSALGTTACYREPLKVLLSFLFFLIHTPQQ